MQTHILHIITLYIHLPLYYAYMQFSKLQYVYKDALKYALGTTYHLCIVTIYSYNTSLQVELTAKNSPAIVMGVGGYHG